MSYAPHSTPGKDRVIIFDTTLRDGEQAPGASMTITEKLEVAENLEAMGVDVIEAGFPIASVGDFEAVSAIAKRSKRAIIAGLARAFDKDVDCCYEAVRHAARPRINIFLSTSTVHMKYKLQKEPHEVYEMVCTQVARARNYVDDVEWTAEDGTRTEIDFLCRCVEAAIHAGARTINIPDTVGYALPGGYAQLFRTVRERVPNSDKAVFSAHCHNDLGLAVANTLAGLDGGARQVECTVNGIGERAGNAALEEIVMALRTRGDALPYDTGIETTMLTRVSRLVSAVSSFPVQYNKAIVGRNAFSHASGVHQDGMLKNVQTYEIMRPETVGLSTSMVLSKHSGRHAFRERIRELGYLLDDGEMEKVFRRFKELADRKKIISDSDIEVLVGGGRAVQNINVEAVTVVAGTAAPHTAIVTLDIDGRHATSQGIGNNSLETAINAIRVLAPHEADIDLRQIQEMNETGDPSAEVSVRLTSAGRAVIARQVGTDGAITAARAYVAALNKLKAHTKKSG